MAFQSVVFHRFLQKFYDRAKAKVNTRVIVRLHSRVYFRFRWPLRTTESSDSALTLLKNNNNSRNQPNFPRCHLYSFEFHDLISLLIL